MKPLDFFIFPVYTLLAILVFHVWQYLTGNKAIKWKIAFLFKIFAALTIGLIYQFYYGGGDTYNFYHHSTEIWNAIVDKPYAGIKLLLTKAYDPSLTKYIWRMWWFEDESSMMVARFAAFFGLFTFNAYTGVIIFFASITFYGQYLIYKVFIDIFKSAETLIFNCVFFIPSVAIWGSGLFKDTLALFFLGLLIHGYHFAIHKRKNLIRNLAFLFIGGYFLVVIKIYILLAALPALALWTVFQNINKIKSTLVKVMVAPILLIISGLAGFLAIDRITAENERYALENVTQTAQITAMDIYQGWGAGSGSAYFLGGQDGSLTGFLTLVPSAIVVTLFRPWPWEISNALMVLSGLESLFFLLFTLFVLYKVGIKQFFRTISSNPILVFCLIFSVILSVGVGISSYNFGTLSRYKIPLLPFYLVAITMIYSLSKSRQKGS